MLVYAWGICQEVPLYVFPHFSRTMGCGASSAATGTTDEAVKTVHAEVGHVNVPNVMFMSSGAQGCRVCSR